MVSFKKRFVNRKMQESLEERRFRKFRSLEDLEERKKLKFVSLFFFVTSIYCLVFFFFL